MQSNTSNTKKPIPIGVKIAIGLGIGLAAFGIWAYSPNLYNRSVSEPFPATGNSAVTPEAVMADKPAATVPAMADKPAATTEAAMADKPSATAAPAMADKPDATEAAMADKPVATEAAMADTPAATVAPAGPITLVTGNFVAGSTAGDQAEGKATIYTLEDGKRILRLENFRTSNGPDLVVAFYTGVNPEKDEGKYYTLEGLKGNQGDQNYELPADFDITTYRSVVIWCRTFNVVFGYAALNG